MAPRSSIFDTAAERATGPKLYPICADVIFSSFELASSTSVSARTKPTETLLFTA